MLCVSSHLQCTNETRATKEKQGTRAHYGVLGSMLIHHSGEQGEKGVPVREDSSLAIWAMTPCGSRVSKWFCRDTAQRACNGAVGTGESVEEFRSDPNDSRSSSTAATFAPALGVSSVLDDAFRYETSSRLPKHASRWDIHLKNHESTWAKGRESVQTAGSTLLSHLSQSFELSLSPLAGNGD